MNRFYQSLLLAVVWLCCCGMVFAATKYDQNNHQPIFVEAPRKLPHFSNISAADNLDVIISGGHGKQSVVLAGDSRAVAEISTEVRDKTLFIQRIDTPQSSEPYNHKVVVTIGLNGPLSGIYGAQNANIRASNISSHGLIVSTQDNASVRIDGKEIVLRKIDHSSSRNLTVFGINTRYLHLKGIGTGDIILGGRVGILTAYLYGISCLRATHLRADEVYVHTENNALAEVLAISELYAFAKGNSNIYFYKTPDKQLVRYTENRGNVLKVP